MKKCIKCGLRFKDRNDDKDTEYESGCCWNCAFILRCLAMYVRAFDNPFMVRPLNRDIVLNLEDIKIARKN